MKKNIFLLLLLLLPFSLKVTLKAQHEIAPGGIVFNPVHTAVPLLSIAPDARAGGMGDIGAATSPDVNSQFWNPAKYVFAPGVAGVGFSYTPWLSRLVNDINLANLSGFWRFDDRQAVSASFRYFSLGDVIFRQTPQCEPMTVRPNELAIDIAYSRLLAEHWSAAVAMRYIRSDLNSPLGDMFPGNGFAADVAVFYSNPIMVMGQRGNLAFGLNISNIGTRISYDDGLTRMFIPTNMRLGGSFTIPIDNFNKISINADANRLLVPTFPMRMPGEEPNTPGAAAFDERVREYNEMSPIAGIFRSFSDAPGGFREEMKEINWSIGLEYAYANQFFVRAGYHHEAMEKGNRRYFTAGVGFRLNVFQIDAAYVIAVSNSNPLDQTLRFSLGFDLEGLRGLVQ